MLAHANNNRAKLSHAVTSNILRISTNDANDATNRYIASDAIIHAAITSRVSFSVFIASLCFLAFNICRLSACVAAILPAALYGFDLFTVPAAKLFCHALIT